MKCGLMQEDNNIFKNGLMTYKTKVRQALVSLLLCFIYPLYAHPAEGSSAVQFDQAFMSSFLSLNEKRLVAAALLLAQKHMHKDEFTRGSITHHASCLAYYTLTALHCRPDTLTEF